MIRIAQIQRAIMEMEARGEGETPAAAAAREHLRTKTEELDFSRGLLPRVRLPLTP